MGVVEVGGEVEIVKNRRRIGSRISRKISGSSRRRRRGGRSKSRRRSRSSKSSKSRKIGGRSRSRWEIRVIEVGIVAKVGRDVIVAEVGGEVEVVVELGEQVGLGGEVGIVELEGYVRVLRV